MAALWWCTRQRAGPLVKECRALRPRLRSDDAAWERRDKQQILRSPHSAVCRGSADRLELRLALMGPRTSHYTLTFDDEHLPRDFAGTRRALRAFQARVRRLRHGAAWDWICAIEGRHGDHRWHVHMVLRDAEVPEEDVRRLWRQGFVDRAPVLRRSGGFRRLAEYLCKERSDGVRIPVGRHPWSCSRGLSRRLPPPERWRSRDGTIPIPEDAVCVRRGVVENDFGCCRYASYLHGPLPYLF